ncbi:cryptochrome/photolyase family protein [Cohnella abietis]|uniref:Deoxyribodipyrimidine photo-lyase n=1 Tax=Cohnella abietis TaxID=2507935 RepID=A0A3T1D050_9BACL|nr:deoxyribodipyrimidine photo-lyase [Cohnella abietis]BBI31389.1 deoxyribodipyrimidine photo-lyase [Cohnella abietis]
MKLFIHRKDLRITDLPAFDYIRTLGDSSLHILILDPYLLRNGRHNEHSGVQFLRHAGRLREAYARENATLHIYYGEPAIVLRWLLEQHPTIDELIYHQDFTPYAIGRDRQIAQVAMDADVRVTALPDLTLISLASFHQMSGRSEGYKVFTPFYRKWLDYLQDFYHPPFTTSLKELSPIVGEISGDSAESFVVPMHLQEVMLEENHPISPEEVLEDFLDEKIVQYANNRDKYAIDATSGISRFLNVGAISVRTVYEKLMLHSDAVESWKRQLAWRDFYIYQAHMDPRFFRYEKEFDLSPLNEQYFRAWSEGKTGIPIIDAAMRELNETGCMPNRLRMVTAMFLTKNLLCPFTYGERYFRLKLMDYDNVLNRGGWLWCSSLGFDAAPYFRIMNPVTQSQTHDPSGAYLRRWLPELAHLSDKQIHLPQPNAIVDLKISRARAIEVYKNIV